MKRILAGICLAAVLALAASGCSDSESPTGPPIQTGEDTTAPAAITDAVVVFSSETGEARLEWTAPADDSPTEPAAAYEIRYSFTRGYYPPDFWNLSFPITDPPNPADPGTRQQFTFDIPARARDIYVGIRSIDEAGNRSESGDLATIYIPGYTFSGRCIDVFSKAPIAGLDVTVSTGIAHHFKTGENGEFSLELDLDGGVTHIEIHAGSVLTPYHALNQSFTLESDLANTFFMIPVENVAPEWAPNLLSLFNEFVNFTGVENGSITGSTTLAKWRKHPIDCYIPAYVNDEGIDYAAQARSAAERWMERTGEPLFTFVDAPPDTGVIIAYKSKAEMGIQIGITQHTRDSEGHPLIDQIWVVNTATNDAVVYKIFLHEFGHTISLGHVNDRTFLMWSGHPIPNDISDPEVRVVELHEALPTRIDMSIYDAEYP